MTPEQLEQLEEFRVGAYPIIDFWCEAAVEQHGAGCKIGCDACCHFVVTITLAEALVALKNPNGLKTVEGNRRRLVDTANMFMLRDPETRTGPWAKRKEPCLFLSDGKCSIYDDRPFNCRTHIAAQPCTPGQAGNAYIDPADITHAGIELCKQASELVSIPLAFGPMPVMLLIAEGFLKAEQSVIEAAYQGTPFLDTLKSLEFWAYLEL